MANKRSIDIKLTQSVDTASVSRSSEAVRQAAEETAKSITATEQEEAKKRVAIAEEEAEAKRRAMESSNGTATPGKTPATATPGYEETEAKLLRLVESMGAYQQQAEEMVTQTDDLRFALEETIDAAGMGRDAWAGLLENADELGAQQTKLHLGMQKVTGEANTLISSFRNGSISAQAFSQAADELSLRHQKLQRGMAALRQEALRQQKDIRAAIPAIEEEGEARLLALTKQREASKKLRKGFGAAMGSVVSGTRAATKAMTVFGAVVGKISGHIAAINFAWDALRRVYDFLFSSSEEAKAAVEEHAEEVSQLRKASDEAMQAQMKANRELRAADAYKAMEGNIERVNKGLERSLRLKERDIALELRRKKLSMDREEWALEEESAAIEEDREAGMIDGFEAAKRLAAVEEKRQNLAHEREKAELNAQQQSLRHKQERLNAALADTEADEARLEAWKESGLKFYSPGQMADFKARSGVRGAMSGEERKAYNANNEAVKRFLSQWGMEELYEGWLWGDVDLPAKMRELAEKVKKQRETLETQLEETTNELDIISHDNEAAAERHRARLKTLARNAKKRQGEALQKMTREDAEQESMEAGTASDAAAAKAKARSTALLQQNKRMISARGATQEREKGVAELYARLSESGDADALKRVLAELARNGAQVNNGGKGWSGAMLQQYGAENIQQMAGLRGKNREWWQERFSTLQQSLQLQARGEKLAAAADALEQSTREYSETVGQVGEEANRAAMAFTQSLEANRQLLEGLRKLNAKVDAAQAQTRYARNTGR